MLRWYVKNIVCLTAFVFAHGIIHAQDPVFTQYYLNKNYLNPAFAGHKGKPSFALNSRVQYTSIPGVLATNTFSLNFGGNKNTRGLGFALLYSDHVEGEGFLHTTNVSGQFSKGIRINSGRVKRPIIISAGLQFGFGQKKLNWDNLQFSDQFDPYKSGIQNATYLTNTNKSSNLYFDTGLGLKGYIPYGSKKRNSYLTIGAAAFHINQPTQSLFGTDSKLKPRYSFFGFTHIGNHVQYEKDRKYFSIGVLIDIQQGMYTNTLSLFKEINSQLTLGISVRRKYVTSISKNYDAIAGHILFSKHRFQMGYSYDFTISTLGEEKTFGSHEIGLTYSFGSKKEKKKKPAWKKGDPCPQPGSVL